VAGAVCPGQAPEGETDERAVCEGKRGRCARPARPRRVPPVGVFEWGFHKSGALALALMRAAFNGRDDGEECARVYAPWFQQDVLARLDKDAPEVEFTVDMDRWVYDRTAKGAIKIAKGATS